jgi:thiol-disulfide isomerase/thioredoxin
MRNIIVAIILVLSSTPSMAQEIPIIKFERLQKIIDDKASEIVIVNFWATWCAPCVAELPIFDKYYSEHHESTAMYLINLDFADKITRVKTFVKKKNLQPPVLLLDEIDYNSWIDKVDNSWSGAIPATLIINTKTGKRKFLGKEMTESDLQQLISQVKTQ